MNGPYPDNAGTSQAAALVSGTFALMRARFPRETARQIVTRALYSVHNGIGVAHQGERIGDTLGYGEILPLFAVTQNLPAGAKNPIYDRFDKVLAASSASPSTSPSVTSAAPPSGSATSTTAASGKGSGSTPSILLLLLLLLVLSGTATLVVLLARRRTRRAGPPGPWQPPGPHGWPPGPP